MKKMAALVGWLNMFNTELFPKRYWWGPRSQDVGWVEGGGGAGGARGDYT